MGPNGMKFGYELTLWTGAGVSLLYIFFGWPPILGTLIHWLVSFVIHP